MKQIKLWRVLAGGLLWLLAVGALTAQIQIGVLYYNLDTTAMTAKVTRKYLGYGDYTKYSGDVVIPDSVTDYYRARTYAVTSIGSSAFSGCTDLTSIEIPSSVTSIDYSAFDDCTDLMSIEIPSSVTSIGSSAFEGCTGLTSVTIPNSVTSIGSGAFGDCTGLTVINVDESNEAYCSVDGVLYNKAKTSLLQYPGGKTGVVNIPSSVTSIGWSAFSGCTGLTSIEIPNSVTEIGDYAFYDCTGLTSIEIPNSVTSIGYYVFKGCTGLTSIEIPNSVTEIKIYAFFGCTSLTSVTIGNSVRSINYRAFSGCTGLTSIEIPNSVTDIGYETFEDCRGLQAVVLGKSVAYIGHRAFHNCNLTSLTSKAVVPATCDEDEYGYSPFDYFYQRKCELIVPTESVAAYKRAPVWKDFTRITGKDLSDRIYVTALRLDPDQASLRVGERLHLHAIVTPDSATNKAVTWSSSNKKVALVDNDGYVMAVAIGTAVITARTTDGSDLSATCNIKVVAGTAVEVPDALKAVRVYAEAGRIEVRGLPLGTAVTLSGVDGRLWYQTEAVTGSELSLVAPCGHVYVLRLNHTHSFKVYLP